ncbi:hypothetical protein BU24DRAFT_479691 [Aaosphaeria arxii CBS 175.79]|uniref:MOSC domain-containing protein n=1 Tax=Aaosphaeria arxii CBS 175.79 TaxID=1450172 RepID=A0A6A5XY73_9PLEO|nr:uncharacterized protein BU24DRAFT_479691 [Aaosphaeria arxii CBS 175.79]KAF2018275.1 hypothetical protein BU24DRAFT_479691 [Aaosphaeria arxii CBS 175.79]
MMDLSQNALHMWWWCLAAIAFALLIWTVRLRAGPKGDSLEITQLYVYPVKGLRGMSLKTAHVGRYGFQGDRIFSLQRIHRSQEDDTITRYETLLIGYYLQLSLFLVSLDNKRACDKSQAADVVVQWKGRCTDFDKKKGAISEDTTRFPLYPATSGCISFEIDLHGSAATAFDMGDELAEWFTERLGFETRLAYIGDGSRPVLGTLAPNSRGGLRKARLLNRIRGAVPFLGHSPERLVFNDLAHYLVVTEESNQDVSSRFTGDLEMDITKFRPNMVVKGSSGPYVEDFWGELTFANGVQMPLTTNCYRCQSITVDFNTGKTASDDRGLVWKKINKDRRVDAGAKYSPVFGRYGWCFGSAMGKTFEVGQNAFVSQVNTKRTKFDWPHLTSFGVNQKT